MMRGEIGGYQAKGWAGYLVLQAKFKEDPRNGDVTWLLKRLEEERLAFEDSASGRARPEYYIIATNVALSGADGASAAGPRKSGFTRVEEALESWKSSLGLKGYDIWPRDKIVDLLAAYPDIRKTFAAWVTPGDVLDEALSDWRKSKPNFERTVRRALVNTLRRSQFTALKDAGSVTDQKIRTSQVFVDVPFQAAGHYAVPGSESRLVRTVIERARAKYDNLDLAPRRQGRADGRRGSGRLVVLGGPGQGKSTAASFVVQLFRASLLLRSEKPLDTASRDLAAEIIERAGTEGISKDIPVRYPILVPLPRYADVLTNSRLNRRALPSLLWYIAQQISEDGDGKISADDLRDWIARYASVIVLDGLDEVPPSGERDAVIEAIASLQTEIAEVHGDALVLVTTRPQGYNRDLDPTSWEHWVLDELPEERALAYAEALGTARYPDEKNRREDIFGRLQLAVREPATRRLMITPLQVTILYLIVDTGGSVPTARWTLFNDYYDVLRKREKAKGGRVQEVLERNLSYIGPIHQRAGLVLQALSEIGGGAHASLSEKGFKALVGSYLGAHGFKGTELTKRANELTELALNRLVLLSARDEGAISFDVRSLQEYMAAAALTSGEAAEVDARLLHISGMAHWRHTFLIAVSRCFAEDAFHYRRTGVVALPRTLEAEPLDYAVRNGARLALEMFADGIALEFPLLRRVLAKHAAELLQMGFDSPDHGLERLWGSGTRDILVEAITQQLKHSRSPQGESAWSLLLRRATSDNAMLPLVREMWPTDEATQIALLSHLRRPPKGAAFRKWLESIWRRLPALRAHRLAVKFSRRLGSARGKDWLSEFIPHYPGSAGPSTQVRIAGAQSAAVEVVPIASPGYFRELSDALRRFSLSGATEAAFQFAAAPSPASLADAIRVAYAEGAIDPGHWSSFPWPLPTFVELASEAGDLEAFLERIAKGDFGDLARWTEAEARWVYEGVSLNAWAEGAGREALLDWQRGWLPYWQGERPSREEDSYADVDYLVRTALQVPSSGVRKRLARLALCMFSPFTEESKGQLTDPIAYAELIRETTRGHISLETFEAVWMGEAITKSDADRIRLLLSGPVTIENEVALVPSKNYFEVYLEFPHAREILYLVMLARAVEESKSELDHARLGFLRCMPTDKPHVRISCTCLAILGGADPAGLVEEIITDLKELSAIWSVNEVAVLMDAIVQSQMIADEDLRAIFLRFIDEQCVGEEKLRVVARSRLKNLLDKRKSRLLNTATWHGELGLPQDCLDAGVFNSI
jgi:hypothetical protein